MYIIKKTKMSENTMQCDKAIDKNADNIVK